jgi:hypothetical protein
MRRGGHLPRRVAVGFTCSGAVPYPSAGSFHLSLCHGDRFGSSHARARQPASAIAISDTAPAPGTDRTAGGHRP